MMVGNIIRKRLKFVFVHITSFEEYVQITIVQFVEDLVSMFKFNFNL
jgi:hypothetical protein